jgi:hypothetical protein
MFLYIMLPMTISAGWGCQDMFTPERLTMHTYFIYIININMTGPTGLRNMLLIGSRQGISFVEDIMRAVTVLAHRGFDIP